SRNAGCNDDRDLCRWKHEKAGLCRKCIRRLNASVLLDTVILPAVARDRSGEEHGCRSLAAALREHEIKGITLLADRSVQVNPAAFHLDVGFIHTPRSTGFRFCASAAMSGAYFTPQRFRVAWTI